MYYHMKAVIYIATLDNYMHTCMHTRELYSL